MPPAIPPPPDAPGTPAWQKWLDDNWARLIGTLGPGILGILGNNDRNDALNADRDQRQRMYDEYKGFGAPYRQRLSDLYADPNAFLSSNEVRVPLDQATKSLAQAYSAKGGNPWGNPAAGFAITSNAANKLFGRLGEEKDRLAGYGGVAAYNPAAAG